MFQDALLTLLIRKLGAYRHLSNETTIRLLPFFCAAVWALHPMQLSTVMYVVQRMTMLSAMFTLLAIIVYLRYRSSQMTIMQRSYWLASIAVLTLLSFLSKENGILTLVYIALIELFIVPSTAKWAKKFVVKYKFAIVMVLVAAKVEC